MNSSMNLLSAANGAVCCHMQTTRHARVLPSMPRPYTQLIPVVYRVPQYYYNNFIYFSKNFMHILGHARSGNNNNHNTKTIPALSGNGIDYRRNGIRYHASLSLFATLLSLFSYSFSCFLCRLFFISSRATLPFDAFACSEFEMRNKKEKI